MADATVTSVEVVDGVLHIRGANFTQTTTVVYVNDVTTDFVYVSASELTVDPAPAAGAEIVVEKGGVQSEPMAVAGSSTGSAPQAPADTPAGGTPLAPEDLLREQEKSPADPVNPSVEPVKAKTMEEYGIGPGQPYPTGNPPDPEAAFKDAHGFARAPVEEPPVPPAEPPAAA